MHPSCGVDSNCGLTQVVPAACDEGQIDRPPVGIGGAGGVAAAIAQTARSDVADVQMTGAVDGDRNVEAV